MASLTPGEEQSIIHKDFYSMVVAGAGNLRIEARIVGGYRQHFGDTVLEAGQTYHVAVTYGGGNQRVYVNGELDSTPRAQTGAVTRTTQT